MERDKTAEFAHSPQPLALSGDPYHTRRNDLCTQNKQKLLIKKKKKKKKNALARVSDKLIKYASSEKKRTTLLQCYGLEFSWKSPLSSHRTTLKQQING